MEITKPEILDIIKPSSLKDEEKKPIPFRDAKFWLSMISEITEIPPYFFYDHERKDPSFRPERFKYGKVDRRIYDWNGYNTLVENYSRRLPIAEKVKTFCNIKGGVGKSTLASQCAMIASLMGYKTLCIDLDPQAHLTLALGRMYVDQRKPIISHYWFNKPAVPIEHIIQMVTPRLGVIPSNLTLSSLDNLLFMQHGREFFLKELLEQIKDQWDLIIIDTSPSESIVNTNAILCSDQLVIPCKTDFFSVDGMSHLFNVTQKLMTKFKIAPTVKVVPNLYDIRDGIAQESLGALRAYYGKFLTQVVVNKNTTITQCQKFEQCLYQANRKSTGYKDILSLTREIIKGETTYVRSLETESQG